MLKKLLIITLVASAPFATFAQLGNLLGKVKNKVNQRVDNKVDKAIDQKLDKAEGKTPSAQETASADESKESASTEPSSNSVKSFSKYDFVPGEQILYYDNFEQEANDELPAGWNTNGTGEVITLDKYPGKWLRLHNPFMYLTSNQKEFTENYTVEFDIIMQLKNNGWMYPEVSVTLVGTNKEPSAGNNFFDDYKKYAAITATLSPGEFKSSKARLNSYLDKIDYFKSEIKPFENLEKYYGAPAHVAIQVQKERFRMWVNEEKLYDVPKGIPVKYAMNQLMFRIGQTNYKEEQYGMYISNIKVATGKPDTRHKLVEEGKFSTTGILFDINSANIKPESHGVVKEIADVLKANPDIKIMITGHTDADGNDKANQTLSEQRASAVKDYLQKEFEISADRMTTNGKGESQPVADNKTKEGKAQNRRVEFVKQSS